MLFFIVVIFMGSFYLVNLILAIVAMSYDDCQKLDKEEAEEEEQQVVQNLVLLSPYPSMTLSIGHPTCRCITIIPNPSPYLSIILPLHHPVSLRPLSHTLPLVLNRPTFNPMLYYNVNSCECCNKRKYNTIKLIVMAAHRGHSHT